MKKNIRERGKDTWAVRGIDLKIKKGEIYGFLGPNGAGKSTTIFMLSTLLAPTSGKARVMGLDVFREAHKVRERIGICIAGTKFYYDLTARESLNYFGMLFGLDGKKRKQKIDELIRAIGITPFKDNYFKDLSTGMRQKLAIAKSLINTPDVLFLDEPTAGLDVEVAKDMRKYISDISKETGMTVLLTSHQLYEVEEMCRRIGIINKGKIVAEGDIKSIRKRMGFPDVVRLYLDRYTGLRFLENLKGVLDWEVNDGLRIEAISSPSAVPEIIRALSKRRYNVLDMEVTKASLEDMFMKIVGGKHD
ncbi:MAG: ABC transporter ATP-binding protein [Candidatus Aenigmarchaeota archaeon]